MYVYRAVVILHFTLLDPLNPKPITEDLPIALPRPPYWRLRQHIQPASRLPLARSPVISSNASLLIGCFNVLSQSNQLPPWTVWGKPPGPPHSTAALQNELSVILRYFPAANWQPFVCYIQLNYYIFDLHQLKKPHMTPFSCQTSPCGVQTTQL